MAIQCSTCSKRVKINRHCPVLNERICSICCATKRDKEISCLPECSYYVEHLKKMNLERINALVKESFNTPESDILEQSNVAKVADPFEKYILDKFYEKGLHNDYIYNCYVKIYYFLEGKDDIYTYDNYEMDIKKKFNELTDKFHMKKEMQKQLLIRMLKSVENMSGELLHNQGYLQLLEGRFYHEGMMSMF